MRVAVVALLLVLAACGGGSEPDADPSAKPSTGAKTSAPTTPTASPTPDAASGKAVPEALSRFRCEKDAKGVWNASGYLSNTGKGAATYQVTVLVGAAEGGEQQARTQRMAPIKAGGSVAFRLTEVPAADDAATCRVQVLQVG